MDEPAYHLDVQGMNPGDAPPATTGTRPWVGVRFDCCGVYVRLYRNRDATAYQGRCPHCLREANIRIGPGGTSTRFFAAQ